MIGYEDVSAYDYGQLLHPLQPRPQGFPLKGGKSPRDEAASHDVHHGSFQTGHRSICTARGQLASWEFCIKLRLYRLKVDLFGTSC